MCKESDETKSVGAEQITCRVWPSIAIDIVQEYNRTVFLFSAEVHFGPAEDRGYVSNMWFYVAIKVIFKGISELESMLGPMKV